MGDFAGLAASSVCLATGGGVNFPPADASYSQLIESEGTSLIPRASDDHGDWKFAERPISVDCLQALTSRLSCLRVPRQANPL